VQIPTGRHLLRWVCYRHPGFDSEPPDSTNSACFALTSSKPARLCVSPRQRTHRIGASSLSLPDCQRANLPASGSDRLRRLGHTNNHLFSTCPCVRRHQVIYAPLCCRQGGTRKFFYPPLRVQSLPVFGTNGSLASLFPVECADCQQEWLSNRKRFPVNNLRQLALLIPRRFCNSACIAKTDTGTIDL